jgi:hypothetical protein
MIALFAYVVSYLNPSVLEISGEVAKKRPKVSTGGTGGIIGGCCCAVVVIAAIVVVVIVMRRRRSGS